MPGRCRNEAHHPEPRWALRCAGQRTTVLRAWLVAHSRYAEDQLAQAVARGVRQYVLRGGGWKRGTFAGRSDGLNLGGRPARVVGAWV